MLDMTGALIETFIKIKRRICEKVSIFLSNITIIW